MSKTTTRKLSSIITINFDSLIDIIEDLKTKNDSLNNRVQDMNNRMSLFTDIKEDIDNVKFKTDSVYSKIFDVEKSIDNHSLRFIELDNTFQQLQAKTEKTEREINEKNRSFKEMEEKVIYHDSNLNNLNRVVEENIKSTDKEKEKLTQLNEEVNGMSAKVIVNEEELKALKATTVENIKRLELTSETQESVTKELEGRILKKLNESDKKMNLILDTMNQLNRQRNQHDDTHSPTHQGGQQGKIDNADNGEPLNEDDQNIDQKNKMMGKDKEGGVKEEPKKNILSHIMTDDLFKSEETQRIEDVVRELGKIQAAMEANRLEDSQNKERIDEELSLIKKKISPMNNPNDNLSDYNFSINQVSQMNNEVIIKQETQTQTNPVVVTDEIDQKLREDHNAREKTFFDHLKLLSNAVETKATKDDLSNILREINSLSHKLTESLHQYETKLKLIANMSKGGGAGVDVEALNQILNVQISNVLKSSAKEIIQTQIPEIDLMQNENFNQVMQTMQNHTDELNKTYESIVDLRNNQLSQQVEDHISSLRGRMTEMEIGFRKVKYDVDELTKSLEDDLNLQPKDGDINAKSMSTQVSLRETVNILTSKLIGINDKVEKLEKKQSEIHKNILVIVKQDLKNESSRILEEFKSDLRISIAKIEDQLREKVDKFNLAEFGQRIDSKLNSEIKRKLDRGDLNKNNSVINRKIDSLEDKISKQIVDTIIDLQLEEAPLIVKKTMKPYDKCASCNQPLPQRSNPYLSSSTDANIYSKYKNTKYSVKDKLPDITTNL